MILLVPVGVWTRRCSLAWALSVVANGGCTPSPPAPGTAAGAPCAQPSGWSFAFGGPFYSCNQGLVCDTSKMPAVCAYPVAQHYKALGEGCGDGTVCASGFCVKGGADQICCASACVPAGCATGDRCRDDGTTCLPASRGTACVGFTAGLAVNCLDDHTVIPNVCDGQGLCASPNVAVTCPAAAPVSWARAAWTVASTGFMRLRLTDERTACPTVKLTRLSDIRERLVRNHPQRGGPSSLSTTAWTARSKGGSVVMG